MSLCERCNRVGKMGKEGDCPVSYKVPLININGSQYSQDSAGVMLKIEVLICRYFKGVSQ